MSNRTKQRRSSGLTLMLYGRMLHPELFTILATDKVVRRAYEATVWLVEGGHVITFMAGKNTLTEILMNGAPILDDRGRIQTISCRGEKYHEMTAPGGIKYMISTQEEQLTQTLYDATKQEIAAYAAKRELMSSESPPAAENGGSLNVLDVERRANELLVQSFHLFDDCQMVIKTQAIIEVEKGAA